eukprot:Rhum_TRINITY_DN14852_c15_g1::Rhum_TRINITY_DN14852_c15_g1_i1::g.123475::m.123475
MLLEAGPQGVVVAAAARVQLRRLLERRLGVAAVGHDLAETETFKRCAVVQVLAFGLLRAEFRLEVLVHAARGVVVSQEEAKVCQLPHLHLARVVGEVRAAALGARGLVALVAQEVRDHLAQLALPLLGHELVERPYAARHVLQEAPLDEVVHQRLHLRLVRGRQPDAEARRVRERLGVVHCRPRQPLLRVHLQRARRVRVDAQQLAVRSAEARLHVLDRAVDLRLLDGRRGVVHEHVVHQLLAVDRRLQEGVGACGVHLLQVADDVGAGGGDGEDAGGRVVEGVVAGVAARGTVLAKEDVHERVLEAGRHPLELCVAYVGFLGKTPFCEQLQCSFNILYGHHVVPFQHVKAVLCKLLKPSSHRRIVDARQRLQVSQANAKVHQRIEVTHGLCMHLAWKRGEGAKERNKVDPVAGRCLFHFRRGKHEHWRQEAILQLLRQRLATAGGRHCLFFFFLPGGGGGFLFLERTQSPLPHATPHTQKKRELVFFF